MNRTCGEGSERCSLCCKLVPVEEIEKPANTRCKYQCRKGCSIYHRRPVSCSTWSCLWIMDERTRNLRRPDRSGYVIDPMPDHIAVRDDKTGERFDVPSIQIWVDPDRPDAHRDPALRAYLDEIGMRAATIRYSSVDAIILTKQDDGTWHEQTGNILKHEIDKSVSRVVERLREKWKAENQWAE